MGDDPMALLGLEGALKHYFLLFIRYNYTTRILGNKVSIQTACPDRKFPLSKPQSQLQHVEGVDCIASMHDKEKRQQPGQSEDTH
jgi:hypothetical protein